MSIKEYDVGVRNVHHSPNIKSTRIDQPGQAPKYRDLSKAGPVGDAFGNRGYQMNPITDFEYGRKSVESDDDFDGIEIAQKELVMKNVKEDMGYNSVDQANDVDKMTQIDHPGGLSDDYTKLSSIQPKAKSDSYKFGDVTVFDYSQYGNKEKSGKYDYDPNTTATNDKGAIAGQTQVNTGLRREAVDFVIEAGLKANLSYPAIKGLLEAMEINEEDGMDAGSDSPGTAPEAGGSEDGGMDGVIESALSMNLSFQEIKSLLEAIQEGAGHSPSSDLNDEPFYGSAKGDHGGPDSQGREHKKDEGPTVPHNRPQGPNKKDKSDLEEAKKKWIQKAVKKMKAKGTEGKFSAKAKAAGESTAEFAKEKAHAKGKLGKEARFAKNVAKSKH